MTFCKTFLACTLCICLLPAFSYAQTENGEPVNLLNVDQLRGQPIPIFDGQSLEGWEKLNGKPITNWVVEDGLLFRSAKGGDLYHRHWFRDFELEFTWKIKKNGNSGVKYRVQKYGKRSLGCEYQMFDDKGQPYTKQSTGALYAVYEPSENKAPSKVGDWNQSKIVVCGNRIEHWLNGELVVTCCAGDSDWLSRVAASKFKQHTGFGQNREGRLFLQDHGNPVWFKSLTLTPLASPSSYEFFTMSRPNNNWWVPSE